MLQRKKKESAIGQFTGTNQTHIYLHEEERVVCGAKSFHGGGLNDDIDIEFSKKIGKANRVSCIRCQKWFAKNYLNS